MIDRIRTRISDLLGIRYPILQAGMIWAAGYKLAVACAEAEILGTILTCSGRAKFAFNASSASKGAVLDLY